MIVTQPKMCQQHIKGLANFFLKFEDLSSTRTKLYTSTNKKDNIIEHIKNCFLNRNESGNTSIIIYLATLLTYLIFYEPSFSQIRFIFLKSIIRKLL